MATEPGVPSGPPPEAVRGRRPPELSAQLLADEVERRGLDVRWVHYAYFITVVEGVVVGFWCARTNVVSAVADMTSGRKDLTAGLLRGAGFEVTDSRTFCADELETAVDVAFELAPTLVVKPARGRKGSGVTVGVTTVEQLRKAWEHAAAVDPVRVVVERQVRGREIRFLVVGGRSIAAVEKRPPTLVGDGGRTIAELVAATNERRASNRHLRAWPLRVDDWRLMRLEAAGRSLDSVLEPGERLVLDDKASMITGGESVDVTNLTHPSYHELAGRIAEAFPGLGIAGVDLIITDPETPAGDGYVVVEVNSMPGLGPHHFPMEGRPRDVARPIVEHTFEQVAGSGAVVRR